MFDIRKFNRLPSWLVERVEQMVAHFGLPAKVFVEAAWRSNVQFFRPYQNIWLSLDDLDRAANYGFTSPFGAKEMGWEGMARSVAVLVSLALYYHRHGHAASPQDANTLWEIVQEVCDTPAYKNLLQGEGVTAERALIDALCPLPGGKSAIVADMSYYLPEEIAQSLGMVFEEEDGTEFEVIGFNKYTWMLLCLRGDILTEGSPVMVWEKLGRPWYGKI